MTQQRSPRSRTRRAGSARRAVAALTAAGLAGLAGLGGLAVPSTAVAQSENLLNRVSNERMAQFEERLTKELDAALTRYLSRKQYVLAVKVVWNPDVVPVIETPQLSPEQQKLPGFPIFVRAPDSPAAAEGIPPFVRLEVRVLIDETLPEYYERFVRKIVPIVARMDFARGDQVVVLKETFPVLPKDEPVPPQLSEQQLMGQLPPTVPPGSEPPGSVFSPQGATSATEAARIAYDEGRLQDALRIVQGAFQRATNNRDRSFYLGLEGSIYYTMGNREAARASWQRAITFDPANLEVHEVLNVVQPQAAGGAPR